MQDDDRSDLKQQWHALTGAPLAAVLRSSRQAEVAEVERRWKLEEGRVPQWLRRWHQTYVDHPKKAWEQMRTWWAISVRNTSIEEVWPTDLRRLAIVVAAYRRGESAAALNVDIESLDCDLPVSAGMDSANAIGTILCSWELSDHGFRSPMVRSHGRMNPDPVSAGKRWLTRQRARLNSLSVDEVKGSPKALLMKELMDLIPSEAGRPSGARN